LQRNLGLPYSALARRRVRGGSVYGTG
jgi:hypothetical protein